MVKSSKGIRKRTRGIMRRPPRERGLSTITRDLAEYDIGSKAVIIIDPSIHGGQPHVRFHGKTGTVAGRQGRAYLIEVRMGKRRKSVLVSPAHMRRIE
ncbi:MAG: 50S ribosomal protein L21e [Candidatus Thermoplasmatota archaeon]